MGHLYRVGVWKRMIYDSSLWKWSFKKFRKVFPKIKGFLVKMLKRASEFTLIILWTKYVFVMYYWINQFIEKRVYFNQFLCSLYIFSCIFFTLALHLFLQTSCLHCFKNNISQPINVLYNILIEKDLFV